MSLICDNNLLPIKHDTPYYINVINEFYQIHKISILLFQLYCYGGIIVQALNLLLSR